MEVLPPAVESSMEDAGARKGRIRSLYTVHACMMIFSFGYSIVLTGVLPYLRRLTSMGEDSLIELFGWMVAINPIGQMIFSPVLGWLTSKIGSIRGICIVTCLLFILGNVIYSCLSLLPDSENGWYRAGLMLFGRLLVGIGTANQAPIRAYIAGATYNSERNNHFAILSLFQTLGFMVGPALQALLTFLECSDSYSPGQLKLDQYTATGWLGAAVGLLSLLSFSPWSFTEYNVSRAEAEQINKEADNTSQDILTMKPDTPALVALITAFFVLLFNFILLETIGTPLCMQQLGWSESISIRNLGIIMSLGAVVSMVAFGSIPFVTKRLDERKVYLLLGLVPMFLARIVILPPFWGDPPKLLFAPLGPNMTTDPTDFLMFGTRNVDCDSSAAGEAGCPYQWCEDTPAITMAQFYVHYAMSAVAFPYCTALCQALFSKVIGPRPQGLWMGFLTAAGSLARICGPVFVSEIYKEFGTYWTYGLTAISLALAIAGTLLTYTRLIPMEMRLGRSNTAEDNSKL